MNQDFVLENTPGNARRLVEMGRLCQIEIDPKITEMAATGLLPENAFHSLACPDVPVRRSAMQFIVDSGLRCTIPGPLDLQLDQQTVLHAIRAAGETKVTIASDGNIRAWRNASKGFSLDVIAHSIKTVFMSETQKDRRDGVLVIDWSTSWYDTEQDIIRALCREFQKTIIHIDPHAKFAQRQRSFHAMQMMGPECEFAWWDMGTIMFPAMPQMIFNLSNTGLIGRAMPDDTWYVQGKDNLAFLYGVFLPTVMPFYGLNIANT